MDNSTNLRDLFDRYRDDPAQQKLVVDMMRNSGSRVGLRHALGARQPTVQVAALEGLVTLGDLDGIKEALSNTSRPIWDRALTYLTTDTNNQSIVKSALDENRPPLTPDAKLEIVRVFVRQRPPYADGLISAMVKGDAQVRAEAVSRVAELNTEAAVKILQQAYLSGGETLRSAIVSAYVQILNLAPDDFIRKLALKNLYMNGNRSEVSDAIRNSSPSVRTQALEYLITFGDIGPIEAVLRQQDTYDLWERASQGLVQIGATDALERALMNSERWEVRRNAAIALRSLGSNLSDPSTVIRILNAALKNEKNPNVVAAIQTSLDSLAPLPPPNPTPTPDPLRWLLNYMHLALSILTAALTIEQVLALSGAHLPDRVGSIPTFLALICLVALAGVAFKTYGSGVGRATYPPVSHGIAWQWTKPIRSAWRSRRQSQRVRLDFFIILAATTVLMVNLIVTVLPLSTTVQRGAVVLVLVVLIAIGFAVIQPAARPVRWVASLVSVLSVVAIIVTGLIVVNHPNSSPSFHIVEISIPTKQAQPTSIVAGAGGDVWFVEPGVNGIAHISPNGTINPPVILPDGLRGLAGLTLKSDGELWFTQATTNRIGTFPDPIKSLDLADVFGYPLHDKATPEAITSGSGGILWVTETGRDQIACFTAAGKYCGETTTQYSPVGITVGPDGALWFTEPSANTIGRMTTKGAITQFVVKTTPDSRPMYIATGSDGALWFTESGGNKIGRITTTGVVTDYRIPTAGSVPWGIVSTAHGSIWFTERGSSKIGQITTAGVITEYPTLSSKSAPTGIAVASDGSIWFTEEASDKIGHLRLL